MFLFHVCLYERPICLQISKNDVITDPAPPVDQIQDKGEADKVGVSILKACQYEVVLLIISSAAVAVVKETFVALVVVKVVVAAVVVIIISS